MDNYKLNQGLKTM